MFLLLNENMIPRAAAITLATDAFNTSSREKVDAWTGKDTGAAQADDITVVIVDDETNYRV